MGLTFKKLFQSFGRMAIFITYGLITLEMVFMLTPFVLYYYSAYSPLLEGLARFPATAWMAAFFLPHLSSEIIPSLGGLLLLAGLAGFLFHAVQLYYAKFRRRGVVRRGLYRHIRHPQYLFLALAGLGLLLFWPRFILLVAYVTMLWLYYLLACDEERRMQARYGEAYDELRRRTSMFLPGAWGGRLAPRLFHGLPNRRLRPLVTYGASLLVAVSGAFALRTLSLRLTSHLSLPVQKMAAVSFLPGNGPRLRELIESAQASPPIQNQMKRREGWLLVHAVEGKRPVAHLMIDAGLTRPEAQALPLAETGIKLVFSRRKDPIPHQEPFSVRAHWQPAFIAEMREGKIAKVLELDPDLFSGNPVMPVF